MEDKAWTNKDADRAIVINSIINELRKRGYGELMEAIRNVPLGTTISGITPTTNPEIAFEILMEILELFEKLEKVMHVSLDINNCL